MAIINRNFLINKSKRTQAEKKRKTKAQTYYNISCPKCGDPKVMSHYSVNRFGTPNIGKKTKCVACGTLLLVKL